MSNAQTSMSNDPSIAYEGMVSESSARDILSKLSQPTAGISAGRFVVQGPADDQCNLPAAAGDITGLAALGFAIFDPSKPTNWPASSYTVAYPQGQAVAILRKGRVWVITEEAVTPASTVYVRHTTGSFTVLGRVRASIDTNTAAALPRARFMTTAGIGALVEVEINL